jgi:hypothetical protein
LPYRLVLSKPGYLPEQAYLSFNDQNNRISFPPLWPVDWNNDGRFNLQDISTLFMLKLKSVVR